MIADKKGHIYDSNWVKNTILKIIKCNIENCTVKELPVKKNKKRKTNTFTYIFTIEIESYEFE